MGFLSKLFGKSMLATSAAAGQHSTVPSGWDTIAASVWTFTQTNLANAEIQVCGKTVPVDLYMYAIMKMDVLRKEIEKTKKAGGRVVVAKAAGDFFTTGLMQLAGHAQVAEVEFDDFASVCKVLVLNFKRYVEPVANALDQGSRSDGKFEVGVFDRDMPVSPVRE